MSQHNRHVYSYRDILTDIQALKEQGHDIPSLSRNMVSMCEESALLSNPQVEFASLDRYTFRNFYSPGILDASLQQLAPPLPQRLPLSGKDESVRLIENIHRRSLFSLMCHDLGLPCSDEDLKLERNLHHHVSKIFQSPCCSG